MALTTVGFLVAGAFLIALLILTFAVVVNPSRAARAADLDAQAEARFRPVEPWSAETDAELYRLINQQL